jgi:M6 family metalloprotease-like protein
VIPSPNLAFTNMLNEEGYKENGGTGSARDYFRVASNGLSTPEFVVVGPYLLPNNRAFYGENDSSGDDKRPREMIADACLAAAADGVDFSVFDTDNDGVVDNVFVYYAGHNEAEQGPDDSVWPHRWNLDNNLMLNNKKISGYACTSELRGSRGANMCGIGTFAHEFGHVYGLVDYYATNNAEHHTLHNWNIMDAGAYLNLGRTPPTYSAYDRFYIGWLTPVILRSPRNILLEDLKTSNTAYIITETGNHNLNGSNPNPVEFFTLENRQKTGWDAYLPASGMLITRIYFNSFNWENNMPNNNSNAMGVDIIEADGIASENTLSGDPFPGSAKITEYFPVLRNGTEIYRSITNISHKNGIITFEFMGGGNEDMIQFVNKQNDMSVYSDGEQDVILDKGKETVENNLVYIYNSTGQLVQQIESTSQIVSIRNLRKNTIYILKSGKKSIKIAL